MLKVKGSNYELKDIDSKQGIIVCYPSIFNNVDSDGDMIVQGAFAKTIAERGPESAKPRIKHLWQHDHWQPIAVPIEIKEDSKGLYEVLKFGSDSFSQDKFMQHVDGIITEFSIGYEVIKSEKIMKTTQPDVIDYYKLTELRLWESSSVTWGANSLTEVVSAKGTDKQGALDMLNARMDKFIKALRNPKYTDESLESFELEIKQIQTIINELLLKQEPVITTPEPTDKVTLIRELNQILFT